MKNESSHCIGKSKDVITVWTDIYPVLFDNSFSFLFNFYRMKIDILFAIRTDTHEFITYFYYDFSLYKTFRFNVVQTKRISIFF